MAPHNRGGKRRFVIVSSCVTAWGGSEELWSAAAIALASEGHRVVAYKPMVDDAHPRVRALREQSCRVADLEAYPLVPKILRRAFSRLFYPGNMLAQLGLLLLRLLWHRPDLVVISQGGNADAWPYAWLCRLLGLKYVVIAQKAADMYWPLDARMDQIRAMYASALRCLFVSDHNLRLTEDQIGMDLPHAGVVRNPFLVSPERRTDWPRDEDGVHLACVARLYPAEKGQDSLLRILAQDKWRSRPLSVTFYGDGPQREALESMARRLELRNAFFAGYVDDVASIWSRCQALVLPTRCEGLPLVLVEAMYSGRVPIVTNVGGNGEVVVDGVSGFVAASATESAFDEALERAWSRRAEWRAIGERAADRIRTLVPVDPVRSTVELFLRLATASPAEHVDTARGRTAERA